MDRIATNRAAMIRGYLTHARTSQSEIARRAGVSRGLVCHVIAGRRKNRDVRRAVAEAIHLSPHNLWGDPDL